ncbi:DoxX family protein [Actinoalloteichus caeruleus]|uniref:DoxX-like family protein n=1 Tax=Actinoalloteichus caeruleus DSM 43889 TaxID=1120930 RepID=A0ABT1JKL1_ACTCY|nr:DoxX family protein [Actinoalloteichus caeruleus]MCP2333050.1 DoxX-like family protein [Actinoalloteichus caeruleus DSM 43889]
MSFVIWLLQIVLAATFIPSGISKLLLTPTQLVDRGLDYAEDYSYRSLKTIGVLEVLGGAALVLPTLFGVLPTLVPLAATGLAALMVGAGITHHRRGEHRVIAVNAVLFTLALIVAVTRFGPYSLG